MASKTEQVRLVFEQTQWYLKKRFNIRIRAETVREFVKDAKFDRILDIGCGDGSISLPLLTSHNRVTLLDLSSGMLSVARSNIPPELFANVEIANEEFMKAKLNAQTYDLILCIGVLAHVDSPSDVIAKIASLSKSGGSVIVESTDCRHFVSHLATLYYRVRDVFSPAKYSTNVLSSAEVVDMFVKHGFALLSIYRYSMPLPGVRRLFTNNFLYKMIRLSYGTATRNRNAWMGNECIYHFRRSL